jgi:hypothetical protein
MRAHALLTSHKYESILKVFFNHKVLSSCISHSLLEFQENNLILQPNLFFLQVDHGSSFELINLVRDIRSMFGIMSTIIILGDHISRKNLGDFLSNGVDQFFSYPFDLALIEDFISKKSDKESWKGFMYRSIPGGFHEVDIKFRVRLRKVSLKGVEFTSKQLIKKETIIKIGLSQLFPGLNSIFEIKLASNELTDDDTYYYSARFIHMSDELKLKLATHLNHYTQLET